MIAILRGIIRLRILEDPIYEPVVVDNMINIIIFEGLFDCLEQFVLCDHTERAVRIHQINALAPGLDRRQLVCEALKLKVDEVLIDLFAVFRLE